MSRDKQMEHALKMKMEAQKEYLADGISEQKAVKKSPAPTKIEELGFFKAVETQTGKEVSERFKSDIGKISETHRKLLQKYAANMEVEYNSKKEYCDGKKIFISLNKQDERSQVLGFENNMRVFLHESGHFMDDNALSDGLHIHDKLPDLRKKLREDALQYASTVLELEKPLKSVKELQNLDWKLQYKLCEVLSNEAPWKNGISDIFDGLTRGNIHGKYGHNTSYWKGDKLECETMAHFFEARAVGGKKLQILKAHFPSAYQYFDDFIKSNLETGL